MTIFLFGLVYLFYKKNYNQKSELGVTLKMIHFRNETNFNCRYNNLSADAKSASLNWSRRIIPDQIDIKNIARFQNEYFFLLPKALYSHDKNLIVF